MFKKGLKQAANN